MKKYLSLPSLYTILVILHVIVGYYEMPTMVLRMIFIPRYLLEIWFVYSSLRYISTSKYMKALSALVVLFLIYGGLLLVLGVDSSWKLQGDWGHLFIKDYVLSFIPIFVFFYFGVTNQINTNWFRGVCLLFIICALVEYNSARAALLFNNVAENSEGMVNNLGYSILSLIPVLVFLKKPILQYATIVFIFFLVLLSYKRGAIVTCAVATLVFFLLRFKGQQKKNRFIILVLTLAAIIVGVQYIQDLFLMDDVFQARLEKTIEGRFSSREQIYPMIMNYLSSETDLFSFIFGNGAYATVRHFATMAHNDWLEFAMDFGLIGLVLYIRYWVILVKTERRSRKLDSQDVSDAIILFAIIYFIPTFFSMSLCSITIYSGSVIGFSMGYLARNNKVFLVKY